MDANSTDLIRASSEPVSQIALPNATFRLKMVNPDAVQGEAVRWAVYNPYQSKLCWEDTGKSLMSEFSKNTETTFSFTPVSPATPARKSRALKLVKIQVGFGCNYSCGYCSQKSFEPTSSVTSEGDLTNLIQAFMEKYDGGEDGKGLGTRVDFIGGETLLYWKKVKFLARELKSRYPKIKFSLYTNGSVIIEDLAELAQELDLLVMLSHDGTDQKINRGKDPFERESNRNFLRQLAARLIPRNLFLVQMTLGKTNFNLGQNRELLSRQLDQPFHQLPLAYDIVHAFEKNSKTLIPESDAEISAFQGKVLSEFKKLSWAQMLAFAGFRMDLGAFLDPLVGRMSMSECHQRCEMDKTSSIAFDLQGNVLTCQNTTSRSGHKIGHLLNFDEILLNTSTHWSTRKNCRRCPVVPMCRGACMYTKDQEFQRTCDSMFSYYLSVLAYSLENLVGWRVIEIRGDNIRDRGVHTISICEEINA